MEAMRQSWSDDRLDDLSNRVDELSRRVDSGFARLDEKMDAVAARQDAKLEAAFEKLDAKIDRKIDAASAELRVEMRLGIDSLNSRFDAMQQTMIRVGGGLIGVLVASGAGLIATQL